MAWKRGTQNNLPGFIRLGQVKEWRESSSIISEANKIAASFKILNNHFVESENNEATKGGVGLICSLANGFPTGMAPYIIDIKNGNDSKVTKLIYLHAHDFPVSVICCVLDDSVPSGCLRLSEALLVNSKICAGESMTMTLFEGQITTAYDCREGKLIKHHIYLMFL